MKRTDFRDVAIHLALAFAVLLGVAAIAWVVLDSFVMPKVARSGWPVVVVPDLTGLSQEDAFRKLADNGLEPVLDPERRKADHVGPDLVALQRPIPGDSVKKGHVVRVWLSAGPSTVPVPDVAGQDSSDAAVHIQEAGLEIGDLDWITSAKVPAGKVMRTDPMNGTLLARGSKLKLVLSSGADPDSTKPDSGKVESGKTGPRTF